MKKLLAIVVLGLLWSINSNSDIPQIKVDALECFNKSNINGPRENNRFIFFSDNKKNAEMIYLSRSRGLIDKTKLSVSVSLEEIYLNSKIYKIGIDRTNGKKEYRFIGSEPVNAGVCKEFKGDIDIIKIMEEIVNSINQKKKDKIKF
tara:strand:- start:58 stop:498 length:441 start_codon:yes stop_codon:yes gene_type:complete